MTTINIPKNLIKEKELILVPRRHYEELVRKALVGVESGEKIWKKSSKKNFINFYSKTDEVYDQI